MCGAARLQQPEALPEAAYLQPALQQKQILGCTVMRDCCSAESSCAVLQAARRCKWPFSEQVRGLGTLVAAR